MKITIKQIAELSGVSKSTVSRYLNGGYVSNSVKELLNKIISEVKYSSNFHAKNLKQGASKLVGVLIPRFDSYSAIITLSGINQLLLQYGYQMIVIAKNHVLDNEIDYIRQLSRQGVDAIIISATYLTAEHAQLVRDSSIPLLFWGQNYPGINCIALDEERIASELGKLFSQKSYQHGMLLTVSSQDQQVGVIRRQRILAHTPFPLEELCCEFSSASALRLLEQHYAQQHKLPQVIIASTDNLAFGAIQFAQKYQLKIPEQLAIIGIGGYQIGQIFQPHLTTIRIDYQQLGRQIAQNILLQLNNPLAATQHDPEISLLVGATT